MSSKLKHFEPVVFYSLLLFYLSPVWLLEYLPSQDGPSHLENANVILEMFLNDQSHYKTFYQFNSSFEPTWLAHLLLAGLLFIAPPLVALKIFVSAAILFIPLVIRKTIKLINPSALFVSSFSIPFAVSLFLHMGFYSFCLALGLCFCILGVYITKRKEFSDKYALLLLVELTVLFYLHILVFCLTLFSIAVIEIYALLRDGEYRNFSKWVWRGLRITLSASLALMLLASYVSNHHGVWGPSMAPSQYMLWLTNFGVLQTFRPASGELLSNFMFYMFCFLACCNLFNRIKERKKSQFSVFGILAIFFVGIGVVVPDYMGNASIISIRFFMFFYLSLLIYFSTANFHWLVKSVSLVLLVIVSPFVVNLQQQRIVSDYLSEYLSVKDSIKPQSTLLALSYANWGPIESQEPVSGNIASFLHADGYLAAEKNLVNLTNYEAFMGYFPLKYNPDLDPFVKLAHIREIESTPPRVNILDYEKNTGVGIDYVLLWGDTERFLSTREYQVVQQALSEEYTLTYVSKPRGLARLYELK